MDPVICLAHGSRHPGADPAVARIAGVVSQLTGAPAYPAYLDFSPLTPLTVAALLAAQGHSRATVVPTLFTRAFHLRHDVPAALREATGATGVDFRLAPGIGTGDDVAALLASRIPPGTDHCVLYSVGSSVVEANHAVAGLAVRVGELAGLGTDHVTATGEGDTGPAGLAAAVQRARRRQQGGTVHVAPLFTAPGTLWDAARAGARGPGVTFGVPLDSAVAPLLAHRAQEPIPG